MNNEFFALNNEVFATRLFSISEQDQAMVRELRSSWMVSPRNLNRLGCRQTIYTKINMISDSSPKRNLFAVIRDVLKDGLIAKSWNRHTLLVIMDDHSTSQESDMLVHLFLNRRLTLTPQVGNIIRLESVFVSIVLFFFTLLG